MQIPTKIMVELPKYYDYLMVDLECRGIILAHLSLAYFPLAP